VQEQRDAAGGGSAAAQGQALVEMFPAVDRDVVLDVLASCSGDSERAVEALLEM
jgi:hypothetical protein